MARPPRDYPTDPWRRMVTNLVVYTHLLGIKKKKILSATVLGISRLASTLLVPWFSSKMVRASFCSGLQTCSFKGRGHIPSPSSWILSSILLLVPCPHSCIIIFLINLVLPTPNCLKSLLSGQSLRPTSQEKLCVSFSLLLPIPIASISPLFILLTHCKLASLHGPFLRELPCPVSVIQDSSDMFYFADHQLFLEMSILLASIISYYSTSLDIHSHCLCFSSTDFSSSTKDCEHSSELRLQLYPSLPLLRFHPFQ